MNPQTLNVDAVMQAVRQGYVPDTWRVYHGRVGWQVQQLLVGLVILLLGFAGTIYLLLNTSIAIVPGTPGETTTVDATNLSAGRAVDFVVLAIFLALGLGLSVVASSRLTTIRDQVLVLMPDGFIINTKKPIAYSYAGMQAMSARNNRGTITFNITAAGNSRRQPLRLDGRFGNAKQLATQILVARNEWQRTHGVAPSQQPPAR